MDGALFPAEHREESAGNRGHPACGPGGLAGFLVAASPGEGSGVPDAGQWLLAVGTQGLTVAVLLLLARRGSPGLRAALFHEQLRTGPGYVLGAVLSLVVLGVGVVMLSVWAPPVMTAGGLDRAAGHNRRAAVKATVRSG